MYTLDSSINKTVGQKGNLIKLPSTPITTSTIGQAQTSVVTWMTKDTIDPNKNNIRSLPKDGEQCCGVTSLRLLVITFVYFLKYFGNFHEFCASRTIWPLVDSYREYLRFVYLINHEAVYENRKLTQTRLCKFNLFNNLKYSL
jgi:hypothetical protein